MVVADGDWEAVVRDSHAVIEEDKLAGVYVLGGGIDESVPPVLVSADGAVAEGGYPWAPSQDSGLPGSNWLHATMLLRGRRALPRLAVVSKSYVSFNLTRHPEVRGAL